MTIKNKPHTTLVLAGSGEFTPQMLQIDYKVLQMTYGNLSKALKIVIIPLAAGLERDYTKWIDDGVAHFKKIGVTAIGLYVANKEDANNPEKIKELEGASMIYFSGGDPGHLLFSLQNSLLWQKVLAMYKNGVILAGCSAGAMIMGKHLIANIYALDANKDERLNWVNAFGLIDKTIIPHYDYVLQNEKELLRIILAQTPTEIRQTMIGLFENSAFVSIDSNDLRNLSDHVVYTI